MNIHQLSASIDTKLSQLENQLKHLQQQLLSANSDGTQLAQDIAALEQLKYKLKKSRDIAWRAHELQQGTDNKSQQQKRMLGIGLCVLSGVGLLVLVGVVLFY